MGDIYDNFEETKTVTRRVLVTDDDPLERKALRKVLESAGIEVLEADSGLTALEIADEQLSAVLLDINMPYMDGIECLKRVRQSYPIVPVIIISGQEDIDIAVEAMKAGAEDYFVKPIDFKNLPSLLERAFRRFDAAPKAFPVTGDIDSPEGYVGEQYVCECEESRAFATRINRVAQLDSTVLITGESGTGKSTIARMIHEQGPRRSGPFVTINCASLPRELVESELFGHAKGAFTGALSSRIGRTELADGGTLFMDEIGDLPLELQPKLLTFLQDRTVQRLGCNDVRKVDVRVIAATHQDLMQASIERRFREDLFYRLNVLNLRVEPLRNRRDDVEALVEHILRKIACRRDQETYKIDSEALDLVCQHNWPGNIRELENTLERATAFADDYVIRLDHIELMPVVTKEPVLVAAPSIGDDSSLQNMTRTLACIEKQALIETLEKNNGNRARTARELGISEKGLYNKLRRHGLYKRS